MNKLLTTQLCILILLSVAGFSQTNEWMTDYVTFDDALNGTGDQTSSVAVIDSNRFVALVTNTPAGLANLFNPPGNYLVGYWDADSGNGRVPSPINGTQTEPLYSVTGQYTSWGVLDVVQLTGAWQLASDNSDRIYVANNDANHNILVFQIDATGVTTTDYRMETGSENIFAIEVDDNGYVYVADYEGNGSKTNEVKVYAGIGAPGTTWGDFTGHNDLPTTTIDLPDGIYQGLTVSGDGTSLFISATSQRAIWKYTGDPVNGYTLDAGFQFALSPSDTLIGFIGYKPSVLGLAYLDNPPLVFAAVDTFINGTAAGAYEYARIYVIDPVTAANLDTIDIAEWNFAITGSYSTGSNNGRAGGFGSVADVEIEPSGPAIYTQTYYGWAVEKWLFDGDLSTILNIKQISSIVPSQFDLKQNYPNPFNPETTIEFDLQEAGQVALEIYNLQGQKVASLINERMSPGTYKAVFDGSGFASGVYFYKLRADAFNAVKKMILTK
jgi:hypothetical protein